MASFDRALRTLVSLEHPAPLPSAPLEQQRRYSAWRDALVGDRFQHVVAAQGYGESHAMRQGLEGVGDRFRHVVAAQD